MNSKKVTETVDHSITEKESARAQVQIDTVHDDEAAKVLKSYDGPTEWSEEEEKRLRRRIDWRLMPVLCMTYTLQFYDKGMIAQAALFGFRQDLGLTVGNRFSFTSSVFYLGFIIGAYPVMVLAQKYPVERVVSIIVTLWGICLILTTACTNYQGIYTQRFFLGILEAGISPIFMMVIGSWYKKDEQALRMGIWLCFNGYSSVVSPLINYGLGSIDPTGSSWRFMFYFAGTLTIVWGIFLPFILPPDPVRAKRLSKRERYILVARLRSNNSGVRNKHIKLSQILEMATDAKFWIIFAISFLAMLSNAPNSTFIPLMIKGWGYTNLQSLLLLIPGGAFSGTLQLIFTYLAMRCRGIRTWLILIGQLINALASLLLCTLPLSAKPGLIFASIIIHALGSAYAVLMGLQIANTAGYTKRSFAASGLYIGYCLGNFVGPLLFRNKDAPRYRHGFIAVMCASVAAGLFAVVYRYVCVRDNRKRDKSGIMEAFDHAYNDDCTDKKNPQFRYVL